MKKLFIGLIICTLSFSLLHTPIASAAEAIPEWEDLSLEAGKLYYKGKLYTKTIDYNDALYYNGVLYTKKPYVFNKKLYIKGQLAKGYQLQYGYLFYNGVVPDVAKYKNKMYVKGKPITHTTIYAYKNKLYKGTKLYKGYQFHTSAETGRSTLFKDGKLYSGFYKKTYVQNGAFMLDFSASKKIDVRTPTIYAKDGSNFTYTWKVYGISNVAAKNVSINNGARIKSMKLAKNKHDKNDYTFTFTIDRTKINKVYTLKIGELKVGKHTKKNVTFKVQNITSNMLKNKYYKAANANHQKYKSYSTKQLLKLSDSKKSELLNSWFFYYDYEAFPNTLENRAYSNGLWGFSDYYYEKLDRTYPVGISFGEN